MHVLSAPNVVCCSAALAVRGAAPSREQRARHRCCSALDSPGASAPRVVRAQGVLGGGNARGAPSLCDPRRAAQCSEAARVFASQRRRAPRTPCAVAVAARCWPDPSPGTHDPRKVHVTLPRAPAPPQVSQSNVTGRSCRTQKSKRSTGCAAPPPTARSRTSRALSRSPLRSRARTRTFVSPRGVRQARRRGDPAQLARTYAVAGSGAARPPWQSRHLRARTSRRSTRRFPTREPLPASLRPAGHKCRAAGGRARVAAGYGLP